MDADLQTLSVFLVVPQLFSKVGFIQTLFPASLLLSLEPGPLS